MADKQDGGPQRRVAGGESDEDTLGAGLPEGGAWGGKGASVDEAWVYGYEGTDSSD